MRRIIPGLGALTALVLALGGLPWLLINVGHALADVMPTWTQIPAALLAPGDGGLFLLMVLLIGWVCWATFLIAFITEIIARTRGLSAPNLGRFFPQVTAARAVSAVMVMFTTLTPQLTHAASITAEPVAAVATVSAPEVQLAALVGEKGHERRYVVQPGDTLWEIADDELGDPHRYPEIFHASRTIAQDDGAHLRDPSLLQPGWKLNIPAAKSGHRRHRSTKGAASPKPRTAPLVPVAPSAVDPVNSGTVSVPGGPMMPTDPSLTGPISTPLHPPANQQEEAPVTPLHPSHGIEGLPDWITTPLIPTARP